MLPKPPNCCVDRRDVVVADQDVLVFFLDQFVARGNDHFHHVLAGRQHGQCRTGKDRSGQDWRRRSVQLVMPGCSSCRLAPVAIDRSRSGTSTCRRKAPAAAGSSCACRHST